jgi:hypothetical protein
MLSKNVYQELFCYAECSLDEEILTFKKIEGEFSKVENSLILLKLFCSQKKKKNPKFQDL